MQNILFIEIWYAPLTIFIAFIYFFLQSLLLVGDLVSSNPLFEKRRLKHLNRFTSFTNRVTPVLLVYYLVLLCKNIVLSKVLLAEVQPVHIYLPLFYTLLYVFVGLGDRLVSKDMGGIQGLNQHINTSGLFILVFIPVSTAMISAESVLELLLPLEFLGLVFYFIFLEYNYIGTSSSLTAEKQNNKVVTRGLLYYFWLSFVGSLFFIIAIVVTSLGLPIANYGFLTYTPVNGVQERALTIVASLVFIGLTTKMGGLFFFFFKADLYKYLPVYGILLFSVYTAFFYLILLIYLTGVVPFFGISFKYLISCCLIAITIYLLVINNLAQKNILMLAALSSVLTLCFCIFIIVT